MNFLDLYCSLLALKTETAMLCTTSLESSIVRNWAPGATLGPRCLPIALWGCCLGRSPTSASLWWPTSLDGIITSTLGGSGGSILNPYPLEKENPEIQKEKKMEKTTSGSTLRRTYIRKLIRQTWRERPCSEGSPGEKGRGFLYRPHKNMKWGEENKMYFGWFFFKFFLQF